MALELTRPHSIHQYDKNTNATTTNEQLFNGSLRTGENSFDPYVSGYAFIKWITLPKWIGGNQSERFQVLSEKNFKSFQGLSNIELDTEGIKGGFTGNEFHYAKGIGNKPSEFTLKYQEHSGAPLTRIYDSWVSGIRDPRTGVATYPSTYKTDYHSRNHTATLLYVVTRPDADNFNGLETSNIERAFLWTHVQPKRINLDHYNFESGDHSFFELEQPFTGNLYFGEQVDNWARGYIHNKVYDFIHENEFSDLEYYVGQALGR